MDMTWTEKVEDILEHRHYDSDLLAIIAKMMAAHIDAAEQAARAAQSEEAAKQ